ncbi:copper chaperone for superoxide dismutase-like [Xenia sp. Carnegie-2017]|uniref:copper chaperone for superoxide dismutase-like n=1 Tax=Xenia sp. Carnegie-2017 TaxID=2897299 RepID=UPI001F0333FA|nr:copper chaperone for superoxide dismutase-like [Xenia sp. Carnegie-2017]
MDESETAFTQMEFAVEMTSQNCVRVIDDCLQQVQGIKEYNINLQDEQVTLITNIPSGKIQQILEETGRKVILRGQGGTQLADGFANHIGAAVSIVSGENNIQGVIRYVQVDKDRCIIDGTIDGLAPGLHGLHIHELGDLSDGCNSVGNIYNPQNENHGGPNIKKKHVGDLGNINADTRKRAQFRLQSHDIKVWDVTGRSVVITEKEDDLEGGDLQSKIDGNSGKRLACGIIARSAGLFQNRKKICACTGMTLWEERELETNKTSA